MTMNFSKPAIQVIAGATLVASATLMSGAASAERAGLHAQVASGLGIEKTIQQQSDTTVLTEAEKRRLLRQQKRKKRVRVTRESHGGSFRN
jgi:choline dehydrogenase-like flavoprotein